MTPCLSPNFLSMSLEQYVSTRLFNLRTRLCMHLLTYKAVSGYIALAGANGLWRRVHWKMTCLYLVLTYKGVSVCSVSHRKTCLCATCHLHISLWFVGSGMFPRKCLDYKTSSFASSHTKKTTLHTLLTYEDMSQYSLAPTFPLLRLVWTKYGASAL